MDPINPIAIDLSSVKSMNLAAPKDSVELFHSLLTGQKAALENAKPTLTEPRDDSKSMDGTLLEDTAKRLNKSEVALDELEWEIKKSLQPLEKNATIDSTFIQSIPELKYKTTAYFTNIMRTESGFTSLGEETESLTKRRGS